MIYKREYKIVVDEYLNHIQAQHSIIGLLFIIQAHQLV
jgi:hypothetical protein